MNSAVTLDDKYAARDGRVFLTGTQALVRLPMAQMRRDRASGLNTATFISGYRGSPLGGYDQQLVKARKFLDPLDITFQPGLNEDLAATAVWGSQQVGLSACATKDGVVGLWYGKGPGVDRSGDALKHANAAGTAALGGVLAIAGDDHTCKSSSIPHQSDHAFISALIPVLYPSSVQEFIEFGLLGIAMSRYSGCWVGFKVISETVETSTVIDLAQEQRRFVLPDDFDMPPGGLNLRWPDAPLAQDERLQEHKGYAAIAFARANRVNEVTLDTEGARFGIVASGKAYEDVLQALRELGIGTGEAAALGLRLYKVRMPWPLEPHGIRAFSEGLEEVLIVEERREIIENQIKQQLFNWRLDVRPRIVGKFDELDRPFLPHAAGLTVSVVARAIADRVLAFALPDGLADHIRARLQRLEALERAAVSHLPPVLRQPHFCAGCPHNTSTRVPEGSKAMAGIGCHFMAQWMDRSTETFTQMGAEGVPWTAIARYTTEKHRFVNLGDGTYFHSGLLAIRQSVAAGVNVTYKVLYNDAVAMTGGQPIDGHLTAPQITHQLFHEGVAAIHLLTDRPDLYEARDLAPGVVVRHRDHIDSVMTTLRDVPGTTAMVFEQTCAAELRRRRKAGTAPDPDRRVFINPAVCEGCGDCSVQSNCIAIEPIETEFGRKRRINQSACNKDFRCLTGFCPSFVTLEGATLAKGSGLAAEVYDLPEPTLPALDRPWNIVIAGVGGSGILTIGAVMGMAAHLEGKAPLVLDMAGLAQKGGAVLSHVRLSTTDNPPTSPRIANGAADLLLAADAVVGASKEAIALCDPAATQAVLNTRLSPVSDFVRQRDFDFQANAVLDVVASSVRPSPRFHDFGAAALSLTGDEIAANMMMLGFAWQSGLVPLGQAAILQAITLNKVAVRANTDAFNWGRVLAHDPARFAPPAPPAEPQTDALIAQRTAHLTRYQNPALARRYVTALVSVKERVANLGNGEEILRAVARNYAKLLSYKDEYEVARLYTDPDFGAALNSQFTGNFRLSFHLAPPFLPGRDPNGRPAKRAFGGWMMIGFKLLAPLKFLRGTVFDPFGHSLDRRQERALIAQYEADIDRLQTLPADTALALMSLPDGIRGFGPVKAAAIGQAAAKRNELLAEHGGDHV